MNVLQELNLRIKIVCGVLRRPALREWSWVHEGSHVQIDHVIILRKDNDEFVSGCVLKQTSSSCLGVFPGLTRLHATMEEHHLLAVVSILASMGNVNISNLAHLGLSDITEGTLVESMEITELSVVQFSFLKSIWHQSRQHIVSHIIAAVSPKTLVWWNPELGLIGIRRNMA